MSGVASATTGTAWVSAHSLSFASAILRVVMPITTTMAATAAATAAAIHSLRRDRITGAEESGGMRFSRRRSRRLGSTFVNDTEDDGHKHQRCNGSANKAADHGATQRRILFTAFAQTERHR